MEVYIGEGQAPNMVFHFSNLECVPGFGPKSRDTNLVQDLVLKCGPRFGPNLLLFTIISKVFRTSIMPRFALDMAPDAF